MIFVCTLTLSIMCTWPFLVRCEWETVSTLNFYKWSSNTSSKYCNFYPSSLESISLAFSVAVCLCQGNKSHPFLHSNFTFLKKCRISHRHCKPKHTVNEWFRSSHFVHVLTFLFNNYSLLFTRDQNGIKSFWVCLLLILLLFFSFSEILMYSFIVLEGKEGRGRRARSNINKVRSMKTLSFKWLICNTLC